MQAVFRGGPKPSKQGGPKRIPDPTTTAMQIDSSRPSIAPHPQFAIADALENVEYIILARNPQNTNTNTNTKYTCDTGQTRNKLLEQWVQTTTLLDSGALILLGITPTHAPDSLLIPSIQRYRKTKFWGVLFASSLDTKRAARSKCQRCAKRPLTPFSQVSIGGSSIFCICICIWGEKSIF